MAEKREYILIDPKDLTSSRDILDTKPGEIRYFLFEDELPIKATAPKEGGLDIEKFNGKEFEPATSILVDVLEGSNLEEISLERFQSLTNQ